MSPTALPHEPQIRLAAYITVLAAMLLWEALAPDRTRVSPRGIRWSGNLGIAVVSTLLVRFAVPLVPVAAALRADGRGWGLFHIVAVPHWLAGLIAFIVLDIAIYLQHRVMHAVPLLWRLHRMHHADLDVDATTGLRFHPIEILLSLALKIAVVIALGAPALAVMLFEITLNACAIFNHANIRLPRAVDAAVRLLLVTPAMHRVHHSIVRTETDSNFGFSVPWWDWLFGTYRARAAAGDHMQIGLSLFREPGASRLDRLLLQPFRHMADR
jgi:sterol desaturase/sphingolipid hydroxylase (fatty acid hydroxylase superfamily)